MRSGCCAVQQALAADAAAVMRQAVSLARRRGHAQVTPLHVATAMLDDAGGLLRAACLRSRSASSHPLQCKALELCLNVALNRLATAGGGGGVPPAPAVFQFHHAAHHRGPPALSNALAAAFKRAQASHRRGGCSSAASGEVAGAGKVELEQLAVSVLDDPSVSRVMREAGFSSADVKASVVEKAAASSELSSNTASKGGGASPNPRNPTDGRATDGDAARVLDCMASGRNRCVAVVGESAPAAEGVVKAVMDKVSKGELRRRHACLKNLQFVPFSAASFRRMAREEVEDRAGDLRALVREGCAAGKGVALVLEDLGVAAEAWAAASGMRSGGRRGEHGGDDCYCPVAHAVMELSSLVRGDGFWLLASGAYTSYTSCRAGQPSLETLLELHPVVVPDDGGLALSCPGGDASELTHCGTGMVTATAASDHSWLYSGCQGPLLTGSDLTLSFSLPATSSINGFTYSDTNTSSKPWHLFVPRQPWSSQRHDVPMADSHDQPQFPGNSPNHPGSSNSVSNSSDGGATEPAARRRRPRKFTELTAENLKILCGALEARVPRHRDVAPGIAGAVLRRRSGVTARTAARPGSAAWLIFQGRDGDGKTAMAREIAGLVFDSYAEFITISANEFTAPQARSGSSSGGELGLKRRRRSPESEHGYVQRLYEVFHENPRRVVLIDGFEMRSDSELEESIKNAIATGTVRGSNGDVVSLEDAIVVLSCEVSESRARASSPRWVKRRIISDDDACKEEDGSAEKGVMPRFSLDLNACAIDSEGEEESSLDVMEILDAVDGVFFFQC